MTQIRRFDGLSLDDTHEFSEGEGRSISESLEVIAMELSLLTRVIIHIAESRGDIEEW